jgi:hypothetical protein
MPSLTPRASGFWVDASMGTSYFPDEDRDTEQQFLSDDDDLVDDGRTPVCLYALREEMLYTGAIA